MIRILFWIVIGAGLGYFFKPQLDGIVHRTIRAIRNNRNRY